MLEWLTDYVASICSKPEAVSIERQDGSKTVVVTLTVAAEDRDIFAGANNRLTRALNSVAGLAGAKSRMRYVLKVVD